MPPKQSGVKASGSGSCYGSGLRRSTRSKEPKGGNQPQNPAEEDSTLDIVYLRKSVTAPVSTPENMAEASRDHFESDSGDFLVDTIGEELTVGNQEGLTFLAETAADLERCHEERTSLKDNVHKLNLDVEYLKERVKVLESESTGRAMSRMMFISTFKRDHFWADFDRTFEGGNAIRAGNSEAHDPDPIGDTALYNQQKRYDEDAYKALYGLSPIRVTSPGKYHPIP